MERFIIKSHVWQMISEKTGESETENVGPWYNHKDVSKLEAQNKKLVELLNKYLNLGDKNDINLSAEVFHYLKDIKVLGELLKEVK